MLSMYMLEKSLGNIYKMDTQITISMSLEQYNQFQEILGYSGFALPEYEIQSPIPQPLSSSQVQFLEGNLQTAELEYESVPTSAEIPQVQQSSVSELEPVSASILSTENLTENLDNVQLEQESTTDSPVPAGSETLSNLPTNTYRPKIKFRFYCSFEGCLKSQDNEEFGGFRDNYLLQQHLGVCNLAASSRTDKEWVEANFTNPTYRCKVCNKLYKSTPAMTKHTRSHTKAKPVADLKCKDYVRSCPATFSNTTQLYKHLRKEHAKACKTNKWKDKKGTLLIKD